MANYTLAIFANLWHSSPSQRVRRDADPKHQSDARAGRVCREHRARRRVQNASEAIRDAVRALQQRRREDALKLERLRLRIEAGIDDLDHGEFVEIDDDDLEAYFDALRDAEKNRSD